MGILTALSSCIFSSAYSKSTQPPQNSTQIQFSIKSVKKSSSRCQLLKSLSNTWKLGWMLHYHSVAFNSRVFLGFKLQVDLCKKVHMYKDSSDLTLNNSACCSSFSSLEGINSLRAKMLIWAEFVLCSSSSPNGQNYGCRHYDLAQLRYLLGGCQIFIQNFIAGVRK